MFKKMIKAINLTRQKQIALSYMEEFTAIGGRNSLLTANRDKAVVRRFFDKAKPYKDAPETVALNKSGANKAAGDDIGSGRDTPIKAREDNYLNNTVEQDRRYKRCKRFKDISISEKILNTAFLLTIGIGYLVSLANMYYTLQGRDGKAGFSIADVAIHYHGSHDQTRLGTAIKGIMEANLKYKSDKDVILTWIQDGAKEPEYNDHIAPILIRDCIACHSPAANPSLPDLTHFSGVAEVARVGGATLPTLVRVSHIHLLSIAFILFFIGKIFLLCEMNVVVKRIAVVIPFVAMLLDITSWFITKSFPGFVYVVVASGSLMGISMGMQILVSMYQMWFYSRITTSINSR